jgi:hypothetical protein
MTATLAITGYGSSFQTSNNDSPLTWTALSEVRSIALPSLSRDVIDAGHESAPNEWRQVLTGLKNAGEITLECNWIKTVYQTLFAELGTTVIKSRRIVFPGGTNLVFDAYLVSIDGTITVGDIIVASVKFRPSDDVITLNIV